MGTLQYAHKTWALQRVYLSGLRATQHRPV